MYMLLKLVTSYPAEKEQYLFSQLTQLLLRWTSIHVATIVTEFMLVVTRGMYDYFAATNTHKQASPESADAYQPSESDLKEIKQYYNGSVKVKIERVKVKVTH